MREIVDKHFYDNWVIPFYLGHYVDLTKEWENYKAARIALGHTLDFDSIQELVNRNNGRLDSCYEDCDQHLIEGVLDEEYVLEKYESLLTILRESNITVRWLMLHRNTTHPEVKKIVTKDFNQKKVLALLLVCSKFEQKLNESINHLIEQKENIWNRDRESCAQKLNDLSDFFGGKLLNKQASDEGL